MATPYFKAAGVLSVAESRSWMVHFFIVLNDIYLPSNVASPSPTPLPRVRTAQTDAPLAGRGAGRQSATRTPTAPPSVTDPGQTGPDRTEHAGHERARSGPGDFPGADAGSRPLGGQRQVSQQGPPRRDRTGVCGAPGSPSQAQGAPRGGPVCRCQVSVPQPP